MIKDLTIGIITCNRYDRLRKCLMSLKHNLKEEPYKIIVVDGCLDKEIRKTVKKIDEKIPIITPKKRISPSAARKIIPKYVDTDYLLFLDDDIIVPKNTIESLLKYLDTNSEVSMVSGVWNEYGKFREVGQIFVFGKDMRNNYVFKKFLTMNDIRNLRLESVRVHGTMSSILARIETFKKINFDERYDFFYELFDFFLQAYYHNIKIEVLPNAIFYHKPTRYRGFTMRKIHSPDIDRKKFIDKWGIIPIGKLGLGKNIHRSVIYQIRRRFGF